MKNLVLRFLILIFLSAFYANSAFSYNTKDAKPQPYPNVNAKANSFNVKPQPLNRENSLKPVSPVLKTNEVFTYEDYRQRAPFGEASTLEPQNNIQQESLGDPTFPGDPGQMAPVGEGIIPLLIGLLFFLFYKRKS